MIKLTFLSDTHLGFDLPVRSLVKSNRRGEDFFTNTKTVFEQSIAEKSDLIIHGGDLFFRSKVPQKIVDRVYCMLYEYAEVGIPIIIVPGNHERSALPQSILLNHPNLFIFSQAERFEFEIKGEKISVSGFPNVRNGIRDQFSEIQNKISPQKGCLNILVMHQAVDGSRVAKYVFKNDADTVNIKEIDQNYDLVLCGHIHRRQILTNGKQPVIYSGSVERTSFQEKNEPKGYYEIELQKNGQKWRHKIEFKELNTRPMIDLNLDNIINHRGWEKRLRAALNQVPENSVIRLNINSALDLSVTRELTISRLTKAIPTNRNYTLGRNLIDRLL